MKKILKNRFPNPNKHIAIYLCTKNLRFWDQICPKDMNEINFEKNKR